MHELAISFRDLAKVLISSFPCDTYTDAVDFENFESPFQTYWPGYCQFRLGSGSLASWSDLCKPGTGDKPTESNHKGTNHLSAQASLRPLAG
ncbi:hypothetical protein TNCV_4189831 [Trichonephila clavipes]|nr:hypothetical protein TNCV_4189831 [Trichonephila clavipes]